MSHENESQQAATELGILLRDERMRRKLSIGDVSEHLKLPTRQIEALEQADFGKLPEPVFVRGFLRSYGRYLNIDETVLNHYLDQIIKRPELARSVSPNQASSDNPPKMTYHQTTVKKPFPTWIFGVAAFALIIGGIYLWQSKSRQDNRDQEAQNQIVPPASQKALPPNVDGSDVQVLAMEPSAPAASGLQVASSPVASASNASNVASDVAAASAPQASSNGRLQTTQGELAIRTRYRSYLTVHDASGQIIFSKLVSAGSENRFQGSGPYHVRIGFAKDTAVSYSGRDINVREHMRDSKTAIFTTNEATTATTP